MIITYRDWAAVQARRRDLLEDAQSARLVKQVRANIPRLNDRLLASTGDLLIAVGLTLKNRALSAQREAHMSFLRVA